MWTGSSRYPDPAVQVLDDSFAKLRLRTAAVEKLATGFRWAEGPVWFGDQRCLIWSDIPNNRMLRWDEQTNAVTTFRQPSNHANGNTRDRQGRLVTCEHETRRITRTEYDGSITVLADRFEGKRFNSPNDIVVKSDDSVWFTDPVFGVNSNYESRKGTSELPQYVYRLDPESGELSVAAEGLNGPNGLAFSPDESKLYVVESLAAPNRLIHVYDVINGGKTLSNKKLFIDCGAGTSDGFRVDTAGNLWCGWGMGSDDLDGVMVFNADGRAIGRIALPERCANLCFGGAMRNRLFMASSQSLYALYVDAQGATLS
ncbi:SMP-30/gluconolactonase/LRE family protein [Ferrovibrio terrae]|uniref:SMP-30/gluconolactonase/LRE family protein n=1 Tax=Ferrovibrio terrae TaxID=2594003 RepID=A0A516H3Y7_9PROT|nr:SMP-30/gluconolactonase/LRE family protein [Ferrovibrio terrae]QDO98310.1 SMP-30/gluconolactonase/LRE family protein [Ferrovibrio terrae]